MVLDPSVGRVIGAHTGEEIRFQDGTAWRRLSSASSSNGSSSEEYPGTAAKEVLRLVLTQVLLSLRWEPTFLGVGVGRAKAGKLVAIDSARRPLLSFLLRYAIGTRDLSFVSEIYWALWCLSQDHQDATAAYDKARWATCQAVELQKDHC